MNIYCINCGKKLELSNEITHCIKCMSATTNYTETTIKPKPFLLNEGEEALENIMKLLIMDITNDYPVCVLDDYDQALTVARLYVNNMFNNMNKSTRSLLTHYPKDMVKERIIGIDISEVDYLMCNNKIRANYFFGHIKENGTVVNKNELEEEE